MVSMPGAMSGACWALPAIRLCGPKNHDRSGLIRQTTHSDGAGRTVRFTQTEGGPIDVSLDAGGTSLRLLLKLSNGPDGVATGTMVSVDQGGAELPIAAVVQTGSHLKLLVQAVAGTYEGDLKDGQLTGTWTQGPGTLPLVFKRPVQSR